MLQDAFGASKLQVLCMCMQCKMLKLYHAFKCLHVTNASLYGKSQEDCYLIIANKSSHGVILLYQFWLYQYAVPFHGFNSMEPVMGYTILYVLEHVSHLWKYLDVELCKVTFIVQSIPACRIHWCGKFT